MRFRRDGDWEGAEPAGPEGFGEAADLTPIGGMSGRALRRLIEQVDLETLAFALRAAERPLLDRVLRNLSARTAAALRDEIDAIPDAETGRCADARRFLMETAHAMEEIGEISFEGPADDALPPLDRAAEDLLGRFGLPEADAADAVSLVAALAERAREHGLLSLEPALERIPEGVLSAGLRLVVDQCPAEEIETVLGRQIDAYLYAVERNSDIAVEGVVAIAEGESEARARARLVAFLPEGEADYERLPGTRMPPSAQSANDLIRLCCGLAAEVRREGLESLEGRLDAVPDPIVRRGLRLALEGGDIEEIERLIDRRAQTRVDRERRKLETLLEGLILLRGGREPGYIREALEGFLEDRA